MNHSLITPSIKNIETETSQTYEFRIISFQIFDIQHLKFILI